MLNRYGSSLAPLLVAAVLTGGCLQKETSATLCLEPDGSVTWTLIERDVHATGDRPEDRQREEDEYLARAQMGEHPAARAFRALHAFDVRVDVLSDEWPYAVLVCGRFPDLALLWHDILGELGMRGRSEVTRRDGDITWTLTAEDDGLQVESEEAEAVTSLLADGPLRLFLRHGRFLRAAGFEIEDDDRMATLKDDLDDETVKSDAGTEVVRLSLTWTNREATKRGTPSAGSAHAR